MKLASENVSASALVTVNRLEWRWNFPSLRMELVSRGAAGMTVDFKPAAWTRRIRWLCRLVRALAALRIPTKVEVVCRC